MQISNRLKAIAEMVTEGNRVVDVGCDHGYLPVYLILNQKIPSAIAMDVRTGPLERALEHISQFNLEPYIETRLSDGLEKLQIGEVQTCVIAGMGGPLMEQILENGSEVRDSIQELLLQPQSEIPHFRKYLHSHGYCIVDEKIILEDGKYYFPMKAVKGNPKQWDELEYAFGKKLLMEKSIVLKEYLMREKRIRQDIIKQLEKVSGDNVEFRKKKIEEEGQLIDTALKRYEV